MPGSSTIVIARDNLSIAGGEGDHTGQPARPADHERAFFSLLGEKRPDVIVLDFRGPHLQAMAAIRKIRQRCDIPIVILCDTDDPHQQDYRIGGAAECLEAPIDILALNSVIQRILRVNGTAPARVTSHSEAFEVAGMIFEPRLNSLRANGGRIRLTTAENQLLLHLLSRPWTVCRRAEIAETLYDKHRPTTDRAIDAVVTRLRKKLALLRGPTADNLIKTEFRTGYMFVGDVAKVELAGVAEQDAPR